MDKVKAEIEALRRIRDYWPSTVAKTRSQFYFPSYKDWTELRVMNYLQKRLESAIGLEAFLDLEAIQKEFNWVVDILIWEIILDVPLTVLISSGNYSLFRLDQEYRKSFTISAKLIHSWRTL